MSTFNQGVPGVATLINSSATILTANAASANALTVRQFGGGNVFSAQTTTGSTALFVNAAGNVGINSSGPTASLDISGLFKVNGGTGSPYAQQGQPSGYNWFNGPYQFFNLGAGRTDGVIAVYLLTTSVWYFSTASVTLVYYYNTTMNFVSLSAANGDNFTQSGTYIMNKNNYNSGAGTYGINYSLLRLM